MVAEQVECAERVDELRRDPVEIAGIKVGRESAGKDPLPQCNEIAFCVSRIDLSLELEKSGMALSTKRDAGVQKS